MNILLFILWIFIWSLTGYFTARTIKIRKKLREEIVKEFFNYPTTKKGGDVERTA